MLLKELIEKLETTDRGGWMLNVAVHKAQANEAYNNVSSAYESNIFVDDNEEGFYFGPSYSQNLDAAMSLVPAGWNNLNINQKDGVYSVTINFANINDFSGTAYTVPMAICVAALKFIAKKRSK
ncbi:MAG: hypothetical protein D6B28_08745 [Gammaproteobacteria bacterium]|nr:MAG: hypothetical protein D6B28_08745 [Gammaproteobacteria bacterium]